MQLNPTAGIAIKSLKPDTSAAMPADLSIKMSLEGTVEALDFAPDAIIVANSSKKVLFINCAAEWMFGCRAADVTGRELDILVPARLQPLASDNLWEREDRSGSANKTVEVVGLRRDGSTFPAEVSVATVDEDIEERRIFVLRDISERKKAEAKVHSLVDEYATASRTKELLINELRHRMRNNLQAILSMIRLEKAHSIGAEAKSELELIENRIIALNGVDGELLASGENQPIDLGSYVRRLADALRTLFGYRAIPLYLSIQAEPIEVAATTAARIGLLINEAITNSFKHAAPKGATEISLSLHKRGDVITLDIADNGPGVGDNLSKHAGGMDLMRQLARQMSGTIQFDWRPGLRCKIELPAGKIV